MNRKPNTPYHEFWRGQQAAQMHARHKRRADRRAAIQAAKHSDKLLASAVERIRKISIAKIETILAERRPASVE